MTEKQVAASRRRMLIAKLILVFSLSVIFFLVAWTWFSSNNLANAEELSVKTEVTDNCVISDRINGTYDQSLTFYNTSDGAALSLPLISSDGTTFFEPKLDKVRETYQLTSDNKADGTVLADDSGKYLVHDIFFKSKTKFSIYLNNDSYVTSPTGFTQRLNSVGFSKDYIAAAVRVGVYDVSPTGNETLKYVWCPNSSWELSQQKLDLYTRVSQQEQAATQADEPTSQTDYNVNLVNGSKVLLAATSGTTAQLVGVSDSNVTSETAYFSANSLTNPPNTAVFTVKLNTDNTYSFLDANDMYFSAKRTGVEMIKNISDTARFTLVADGANILLKTKGGYYLFFDGTGFDASTEQPSISAYNYTVFSYTNTSLNAGINTNGTIREPKFINNQYSTEQTYSARGVKYFTTLNPRDGKQLISELKTNSGWQNIGGESGYGFAHIRVRIWVEGTDEEAVSLLKDGRFETYLHFVSA